MNGLPRYPIHGSLRSGMDGGLLFSSLPRGRGVILRGEKARHSSRLGTTTWLRLQDEDAPPVSYRLPSSHPVSPLVASIMQSLNSSE